MPEKVATENSRESSGGRAEAAPGNGAVRDESRGSEPDRRSEGEGPNPAQPPEPAEKPGPRWVKPLVITLLIVALVIAIPWGLNYWHFASTHVSTDDAYVRGNLVNVSPIISGTLAELTVDEGAVVHRGELIARLSDAGPRSAVNQARANYAGALSQIPQAERNLMYQRQATDAAIRKAQAALSAQTARTGGAQQQVALTAATTQNQVRQAESQLGAAEATQQQSAALARAADAAVATYQQAIETAAAGQENVQQQVETAQQALQAAEARVQAAQSEVERTTKDEARYRVLYVQDAVSAQVYDNARAAARSAQANLQASRSQAAEARSQVEQTRATVRQAQSQVEQARKNVAQAQAQARAAHRAADAAGQQVGVARAGVGLARANTNQTGVQRANLLATARQAGENQADIENANAGEQQVAVRRKQIETYRAQAQQALAALHNAEITLGDTKIYAPTDGIVVRKNANVGASLSPGQAIVTITQGEYVWVEANFKETQLKGVQPGSPAEIEVDAVPGKVFKGRVQSINEATGAATSLLPPDNATGNFTKVVQRVPVRIEFVPAADNDDKRYARRKDMGALRQGMSVTATIDTHGERKPPASAAADGRPVGMRVRHQTTADDNGHTKQLKAEVAFVAGGRR